MCISPQLKNPHPFITSQFCRSGISEGFSALGLTRLKLSYWPGWALIWAFIWGRIQGRICFQNLLKVVGRIQFLVVGLRFSFSCLLAAEICSQRLEITHTSCHEAPPSSSQHAHQILLEFCITLTFHSATSCRKHSAFKRPHEIRLDYTLLPYNHSSDHSSCNIITAVRSLHIQFPPTLKREEIIEGQGSLGVG